MTQQPTSMIVLTNIKSADEAHVNDWFPYRAILSIGTSQPDATQDITCEIRDSKGHTVEVAQVDPEFDKAHQVINLKIQTFEDLEGQLLTCKVAWADSSGEEYSDTFIFQCV